MEYTKHLKTLSELGIRFPNLQERLKAIKKYKSKNIVIICNEEESKKFWNLKFPFKVRNLHKEKPEEGWDGKYKIRGYTLNDTPYNCYCWADYYVQKEVRNQYVLISFNELMKSEILYALF